MYIFGSLARTLFNRTISRIIFLERPNYLTVAMLHNKGPRIRLIPQQKDQAQKQKPQRARVDPKEVNFQPRRQGDTHRYKTNRPIKTNVGQVVNKVDMEAPIVQKPVPKLQKQPPPKIEPAKTKKMEEMAAEESAIEEVESKAKSPNVGTTIISTVTQTDSTKKGGEDATQQEQENSWQTMKFTFTVFGVSFTGIGLFLLLELGKPKVNEEGQTVQDEFSGMPLVQQYVFRMVSQLDYYRKLINEPSRDKLLPDELKYPYHQPPYTLVLELKDVLVHPDWTYNTGWRFKKRPGIDQFLETLNGVYEIVIYTAELGMTVFPILEALDPNNLITYKLVRDATNFVDGKHVKDLDKLNRPLRKVVLVDWDGDAIAKNRDNALLIPRWNGDDTDTALLDLANLLRVIAISEIQDVREVLRFYKEYDNPLAAFRDRQRELERTMYSNK